jgi:hypothetical protein
MGEGAAGMRRGVFVAWLGAIIGTVLLQSAVHLEVVLGNGEVGSIFDLDRSNSLPDLGSTASLTAAAAAAAVLGRLEGGRRRAVAWALAVALTGLTIADLAHDGPHPASAVGWAVIAMVVATGVLLVGIGITSAFRARVVLGVAACTLLGSFCVNALDQINAQRFERERGDPIAEYQIVTKEGLELLGWSLAALALWDEALRRRSASRTATAPTSRGRAASRRRAA